MNSERLLAHFETISESEEAVPRLRQFILDLAVRGKLVKQILTDEPAGELLKRIQEERTKLVEAGSVKDPQVLAPLNETEFPYPIPLGWKWIRLGDSLNNHLGGGTPSKTNQKFWGGRILWASVKDIGKTKYVDQTIDRITAEGLKNSSSNLIPEGCLIVVTRMGLGKVSITRVPMAINQDLRALFLSSLASIDYYYIFFKTASYQGSGLTVKGIKVEQLLNFRFPLPPLAEQKRIAEKVDELMALCDELEAARTKRETCRDRLVAATLHRLNNGYASPEAGNGTDFKQTARFYLNHLPRLTATPDYVRQTKQTILSLAVRGELVPQESQEESADILLKRLTADIDSYAHIQGIAPAKAEPIDAAVVPYCAPPGWVWVRLCSLFRIITDGDHQPPPKASEGVAFLTIGNISSGKLDFTGCRFVPKRYFESLPGYRRPRYGDILYTVVGATYGRPAFVGTKRDFCVQRHVAILKPSNEMDVRFLFTLLASPQIYEQATRSTTGTAQPTIPLRPLRNFMVLLPPLAEQRRIVAKVDELLALCNELEAQLATTITTRSKFLEATLRDAVFA